MLKTILDYDNPVMSFISRLIDLFTLSLLWLLCSLPIITIGAANCSLYYAVIKSVRHQRSYPVKEFFKCFRQNIKASLILCPLFLLLGIITFGIYFPLSLQLWFTPVLKDKLLSVLLLAGIFLCISLFLWSFPVLSRFDAGILQILELSLLQIIQSPLTTVIVLLLTVLFLVLVYLEPLLLCILPGLLCWLLTFLIEPKLNRIYRENFSGEQLEDSDFTLADPWFLKE